MVFGIHDFEHAVRFDVAGDDFTLAGSVKRQDFLRRLSTGTYSNAFGVNEKLANALAHLRHRAVFVLLPDDPCGGNRRSGHGA